MGSPPSTEQSGGITTEEWLAALAEVQAPMRPPPGWVSLTEISQIFELGERETFRKVKLLEANGLLETRKFRVPMCNGVTRAKPFYRLKKGTK